MTLKYSSSHLIVSQRCACEHCTNIKVVVGPVADSLTVLCELFYGCVLFDDRFANIYVLEMDFFERPMSFFSFSAVAKHGQVTHILMAHNK